MAQPFGPDIVPSGYSDPNFNVEAQGLARQRAIANAIMARSLQPPAPQPANGGLTVPISPLQSLSGLVQQYFAGRAGQDVDQQEQNLATRYSQGEQAELQKFLANPNAPGADIAAAASNYARVRAVGEAAYQNRLKQTVGPKDIYEGITKISGADPQSQAAAMVAARQPGGTAPETLVAPKKEFHVTNENIVTGTPENPNVKYIGPTFTPPVMTESPAGAFLGQSDTRSQEVKPVQKSPVTNIINSPENKAAVAVATGQADLLKEAAKDSHKGAMDALGDLRILSPAIDAYNRGIFTGMGQGINTAAGKFLEAIHMKSPDSSVSDTDFFAKTMASRILKHTAELRPMSDPDRQFLEGILGGKNVTDSTLRRILDLGVQNNMQALQDHAALVEKYSGAEGSIPGFKNIYSVPSPTVPKLRELPQGPQPLRGGTMLPFSGEVQQ